jgi:predicted nucleic-acid-binding protein
VRITADTNILVRALTGDDETQSPIAEARLADAELVAITLPALCELVWVLSSRYGHRSPAIIEGIRRLIDASNVAVDRQAVEAGLAMLARGGDFADGVIAREGAWLGADVFLSFDKGAVSRLVGDGVAATLAG